MYNQDTTEQGMTAIALSTVITTQINRVRSNSHVNLCHNSSPGSSHFQLQGVLSSLPLKQVGVCWGLFSQPHWQDDKFAVSRVDFAPLLEA